MAGDEFPGREPPGAFTLKLENSQALHTTADNDARFVCVQNFGCVPLQIRYFGLPDFEQMSLRARWKESEGSWPWDQTANSVPNRSRRLRPVDETILFFYFPGVG